MRSRALSVFNAGALLNAGRGGAAARAMSSSGAAASRSSANAGSSSPPSSTSAASTSTDPGGDAGDSALHRPLRLLLLATLAGAAAAVLPQTLAPSPRAAVALLRADGARLRASGAGRAARIAESERGARALAEVPGAAAALLDAAFPGGGQGGGEGAEEEEEEEEEEEAAAAAALKAAVAWAAHPEGAAALKEAGAVERAEAAMKKDKSADDARHLCWLLGQRKGKIV